MNTAIVDTILDYIKLAIGWLKNLVVGINPDFSTIIALAIALVGSYFLVTKTAIGKMTNWILVIVLAILFMIIWRMV